MTQRSAAAIDAARRLWATDGRITAPEEVAAQVDRVCAQLDAGLARWVGSEGYRVLLDRALGLTRAEHPVLNNVSCRGGDELVVTAAVRAHGAAEVAAGMVTLLATLIDLLGRIIGEEMAVQLLERARTPSRRTVPGTEMQVDRDG
jgi:hypothetical protein